MSMMPSINLLLQLFVSCLAATSAVNAIPANSTSNSTLTGDMQCSSFMCITATVNGSTVEYVLESTGAQPLGWMGMGFGSAMENTPMVIMWPNSSGSVTISQRKAPSEVMPTVDPSPPRVATFSPSLSIANGTQPKFAYSIPANSDTKQNVIWGFGVQSPSSSAVDATLQQHLGFGTFTLDLTKPMNASTPPTVPTPSSSLLPYQRLILVHGTCCAIGFMILLPLGVFIARYTRTFSNRWFNAHATVQLIIAGPTIIVGVALGIISVNRSGGTHLSDDHMKWGIGILVLYLAQCTLGAIIHYIKPKNKRGRPIQNYAHVVVGLLVIGLGFYQVHSGYADEWVQVTARTGTFKNASIVYWILVVAVPVLYLAGLSLLPRQLRQERAKSVASFDYDMIDRR